MTWNRNKNSVQRPSLKTSVDDALYNYITNSKE